MPTPWGLGAKGKGHPVSLAEGCGWSHRTWLCELLPAITSLESLGDPEKKKHRGQTDFFIPRSLGASQIPFNYKPRKKREVNCALARTLTSSAIVKTGLGGRRKAPAMGIERQVFKGFSAQGQALTEREKPGNAVL